MKRIVRGLYLYATALIALGFLLEGLPALMTQVVLTGFTVRTGPYLGIGPIGQIEDIQGSVLITLVGLTLWVVHWGYANQIAARLDDDGAWERGSPIRRAFFYLTLFLGALMILNYGGLTIEGILGIRSGRLVVADFLTGEFVGPLCSLVFYAVLCGYHVLALYLDRQRSAADASSYYTSFG